MLKKTKVVILPTNEKAIIHSYMYKLGLRDKPLNTYQMNGNSQISYAQHLYILSDEEIKEGEKDIWIFQVNEKRVHKLSYVDVKQNGKLAIFNDDNMFTVLGNCKKIIATTDKSLTWHDTTPIGKNVCGLWKVYPQPSQSFIEKFVEEYNKGNIITEVMVEYENIGAYANPKYDSDYQLKVNPKDNTITIKPVKELWNREEVIEFAEKYARMVQEKPIQLNAYKRIHNYNWIEQNL